MSSPSASNRIEVSDVAQKQARLNVFERERPRRSRAKRRQIIGLRQSKAALGTLMDHSTRLALMLTDMEKAPAQFKPAHFWQTGLRSIVEDLRRRGFEDFRDHRSARKLYVPGFSSRT